MQELLTVNSRNIEKKCQVVDSSKIEDNIKRTTIQLPCSVSNNQPLMTEDLAELVAECTIRPDTDGLLPYRKEVVFENSVHSHKAIIYWVNNSSNQDVVDNSNEMIDLMSSESFNSKMTRKDANGTSFEFGIGEHMGQQTTNMRVNDINLTLPYIRNDKFIREKVREKYGDLERCLVKVLTSYFPEDFSIHEIAKGYFPKDSDTELPSKFIESMSWPGGVGTLPYTQRSIRLNGNWSDIEWIHRKIGQGGSTLHCDTRDAPNNHGSFIFYFNPTNATLPGTDLLIFEHRTGGRCVRVKAMEPGWTCVVRLFSSEVLHGSVYPNKSKQKDGYEPNDFYVGSGKAFRVICYSLKGIVKLASLTSNPTSREELILAWISRIIIKIKALWLEGKPIQTNNVWVDRHIPVLDKAVECVLGIPTKMIEEKYSDGYKLKARKKQNVEAKRKAVLPKRILDKWEKKVQGLGNVEMWKQCNMLLDNEIVGHLDIAFRCLLMQQYFIGPPRDDGDYDEKELGITRINDFETFRQALQFEYNCSSNEIPSIYRIITDTLMKEIRVFMKCVHERIFDSTTWHDDDKINLDKYMKAVGEKRKHEEIVLAKLSYRQKIARSNFPSHIQYYSKLS